MRNKHEESYGSAHLAHKAGLTCDCLQSSFSDPRPPRLHGVDAALAHLCQGSPRSGQ